MAVLECLHVDAPSTYRDIAGERVVFGRHPSCEVVIDNAAVSRYHARILQVLVYRVVALPIECYVV